MSQALVAAGGRPVVLNTRPREQAAELSRLLVEAGYVAWEVPLIEVVPAGEAAELALVAQRLQAGAYYWVMLGSQNAGRYLEAAVGHDALAGARILCGQATAAALGLSEAVTLSRFSAAAALDALRPLLGADARVLVPRAEAGREELLDGLAQLGVATDAPVCYRTSTVPPERLRPLLAERHADAITLCSPSAVQALVAADAAAVIGRAAIVCLGQTTAQAASAAGLRVGATAAQTSMADLVAAVRSVVRLPA